MKTKTENILMVLKVLALLAGIGFSIQCGSQILSLVAGFINSDWSKHVYDVNQDLFSIREHNTWYYVYAMSLIIAVSALNALIWYLVFHLLLKLRLTTPFSIEVEKKLERISYLLFAVWCISIIGKGYIRWLSKSTGIHLSGISIGDEYLFIAGIIYIISQVFKRGIEIQEENQLTV
ncbi:MAG TPA: DUF2975 domain-containing protein [Chitinophagaceae bacterium]|nr:DUF2975 domain-containing protein [Chitinophagaceae bacterium]